MSLADGIPLYVSLNDSEFDARAAGYGARLGSMLVRLAPSVDAPLRFYTQDSLAPRSDDRSSSEENVLDLGHIFSRTDLTGGAGLDVFPRSLLQDRAEDDNIRFWDSMNVDVRRSRIDFEYAIRLHRKLEEWNALGGATHIVRTSTLLVIADGSTIRWYDTLDNTVQEGSTSVGSAVDAMCRIGEDVYALAGNVIYKKAPSLGFVSWHTPGGTETIEGIWGIKGRILAHRTVTTPSNELVEIAPDGTTITIIDNYEIGVVVNQIVDGGPAVVAALNNGYLYSYTLDDTQILQPKSSTPVPVGEEAISMVSNQGSLAYMTIDPTAVGGLTTARLYVGEVLDSRFNFTIGNSDLIMEWDSPITAARASVSELVAARDDIWFVVYEPDVAGDKYVSFYRYDIVTRGYNRAHSTAVASDLGPTALTTFEDRFVYIQDDDVWVEADDAYADEGWIIYPYVNFGLNTDINWVASTLDVVDLTSGGTQVELFRSSHIESLKDWQDSGWVNVQTVSAPEQAGTEVSMVAIQARGQALQLRIYPNTSGTPGIRNTAIRGLPAHRDLIIELPINISDLLEVPGRAPRIAHRLGDEIHTALFELQGSHLEVVVFEPPLAMLGIVDAISEATEYITSRGSQGRMCMLRIRGSRLSGGTVAFGTGGVGVARVGISLVGVGAVTELT